MRSRTMRETARERRELAADAGFGPFSFTSVLAGVLVGYGAFAVLAGIAAAVLGAVGDDTDLTGNWEALGTTGGLVVAGLLFLSYLLGGYVAGRMARRNGIAHGFGVLVLGLVIAGVVAALVRESGGVDTMTDNLRSFGIPTTAEEWGDAGTVAGIASLVAMLAGSLLGGALGERWHARLFARAADPNVGAQAAASREAEEARTRANLALARSEGRARAHELERDRDRDGDRTGVIDTDKDRDRDRVHHDQPPAATVTRRDPDGDPEREPDPDDTFMSGNGHRRVTRHG
ncbi:MAG TPA: TIGR04086 family membrane protein [Acidimicrobiales bacterium]|nr:TIGR04086 family membrane protein [Acidimicrobiales bacterium]